MVPLLGQERNNAGGYAFRLTPAQQLERFLILGTEGGTYHVSEHRLTLENVSATLRLLYNDPAYVVARTVEISLAGRGYKNDLPLFVLALAHESGDSRTRNGFGGGAPRSAHRFAPVHLCGVPHGTTRMGAGSTPSSGALV